MRVRGSSARIFDALNVFRPGLEVAKIYAGKFVKQALILALILFGLGSVGLLPRSPFRFINEVLLSQQHGFMHYVIPFLPIVEILTALHLWVLAIISWYFVKVALRLGKVIS